MSNSLNTILLSSYQLNLVIECKMYKKIMIRNSTSLCDMCNSKNMQQIPNNETIEQEQDIDTIKKYLIKNSR